MGSCRVKHDIIVVGASAGGVEALQNLMGGLPARVPAAFFVVLHLSPFSESHLPSILERAGKLPARHPRDSEKVRPGRIYVAPPDRHLILAGERIRLGHGPTENRHRPSIDVLFRSAANAYGPRVAGVLLTGNLDDGVAGLAEIKKHSGLTIVQDPKEAPYPDMPFRALEAMRVDWCLTLNDIRKKLIEITSAEGGVAAVKKRKTTKPRNQSPEMIAEPPGNQPLIPLVCPDCQGPLWEFRNGELQNFRCLVGHRYTLESLLAAHSEELEQALWVALRTLEERILLQRRLADTSTRRKNKIAAANFSARANKNAAHAKVLRRILEELSPDVNSPQRANQKS